VAVAWSSALSPLLTAVGGVISPRVASQTAVGAGATSLAKATRLGSAMGIVAGFFVLILTPLAVPMLFGNEFRAAIPAALILVVGATFGGMNVILQEGARGLGHPTVVLWSEGCSVLVGGAVLLVLLPPLGILGAAIASLVAYATTTGVLVLQIGRITGCSPSTLLLPASEDWVLIRSRLAQFIAR
jgi:O-antigen/teichoic acid export membrane protein